MVWCRVVWYGIELYCIVWCGVVWYGMVCMAWVGWYGVVRYGMVTTTVS